MFKKIVCSDIDGTLLNKDRELSSKTIEVVKSISPVPFILISSRMPRAMFHLQKELGITNLPMIAYNGALLIDQEKVLYSSEIDSKIESVIEMVICSESISGKEPNNPSTVQKATTTIKPSRSLSSLRDFKTGSQSTKPVTRVTVNVVRKTSREPSLYMSETITGGS